MSDDGITQWLRRVLTPYRYRDAAFAQTSALLRAYPSLSPRTDTFTFDDGRTALLLCLSGTTSVAYRGTSYNIPIAVWTPHEFPHEAPICFVTPTPDMVVRRGPHVDPGGRCSGGYLDAWQSKPEGCSLVELIQYLQDVFSREPPLYSKPKSQPSRPPPATLSPEQSSLSGPPRPAAPPRPPPPPQLGRSPSGPPVPVPPPDAGPSRSGLIGAPQIPPHPPGHAPWPFQSPPWTIRSPHESDLSPPGYHPPVGEVHPAPTQSPLTPVHVAQHPHFDHQIPYQSQHQQCLPPPTQPCSAPPRPRPQGVAPDPRYAAPAPTPPQAPPGNFLDDVADEASQTVTSASQDPTSRTPAPPRPPHPALLALRQAVWVRVSTALEQLSGSLASEHNNLIALQNDLLRGEPALLDEIGRLEAVRDVCVGVAGKHKEAGNTAEQRTVELEIRGEPDPDEMVCSTTVLYNQLLDLYAEDQALEDTLYHLSRALNTNAANLDIDRFFKRVRAVGREQFLVRCQVNKILFDLAVEGKPAAR